MLHLFVELGFLNVSRQNYAELLRNLAQMLVPYPKSAKSFKSQNLLVIEDSRTSQGMSRHVQTRPDMSRHVCRIISNNFERFWAQFF